METASLILIEQQPGFDRTATPEFDDRTGPDLIDNISGMGSENRRFRTGQIILRLLADLFEQQRPLVIVEVFWRNRLLGTAQSHSDVLAEL
jgi:hypothetical protein